MFSKSDPGYTGWSDELPRPTLGGFVGPGWLPIVVELHKKLVEIDPDYNLDQVKEKFGGLRYYFSTDSDRYQEMEALVDEAEARCRKTCEECGEPGTIDADGCYWLLCLCEKHHADRRAAEGGT